MQHLVTRFARPALLAGLALLALRLALWPFWDGLDPSLRLLAAAAIMLVLLIALFGAGFAPAGTRHRNLVTWLSVAALIGVIPVFDHDFEDLEYQRTWLAPPVAVSSQAGQDNAAGAPRSGGPIVLNRQRDGHYNIEAEINGARVPFLVDTGASGIALTLSDAGRIGIRTHRLDFSIPVSMASGQAMAAPVTIRSLDLQGHHFEEIPAVVMPGGEISLLGMSVLERFSSLEIRENQLILQP